MDISSEVFASIAEDIMGRTNLGHEFSETSSKLIYNITDFRKAKYLFSKMDIDGSKVDRNNILRNEMLTSEKCENNAKNCVEKYKRIRPIHHLGLVCYFVILLVLEEYARIRPLSRI